MRFQNMGILVAGHEAHSFTKLQEKETSLMRDILY